jgi:hypothetical protein
MRILMLIAAAATIGSCSRPVTPPRNALAEDIGGRLAGPAQSCVSTMPNQNLRILDPQTIAYGWGKTIYVNRLPGPCPTLSQFNTIIVDAGSGSEYCRGDRVRGLEPGSIIAGPTCNLGDWVSYRRP